MPTAKHVVGKLNVYICRMPSKIYERYLFRLTKQEPGENFENFLLRLRNQSAKCQFKDANEHLIDQIVEKCISVELRQKVLAADDTINLTGIISEAKSLETVNLQTQGYVLQQQNTLDTNHINFSKDVKNSVGMLAVDTTTRKNIPCDKESNSMELSDKPTITKPTCDLKVEFDETSISGSTCAVPGQSIEPTKTETLSQVIRSIDHDYAATPTTQPEEHAKQPKEEKQFKCNLCDYATTQRRYLHEHKVRHQKPKLLCPVCGFTSSASSMNVHMLRHTGEKPFKCSICGYAGTSSSTFTAHMRIHTGEKPFSCSVCDYRSAHRHNLVTHMRRHTGEKPYKCSICSFSCAKSGGLKVHMRGHTGERPLKCSLCDYACKDYGNLKIHKRNHTGERPYKCSECNFASKQKTVLIQHIRTHSDEKPFQCSECDYACKQNSGLVVHMRKHTGQKPYKCSVCEFTCSQNGGLKKHMRGRH